MTAPCAFSFKPQWSGSENDSGSSIRQTQLLSLFREEQGLQVRVIDAILYRKN
jgi:hypothetical protein